MKDAVPALLFIGELVRVTTNLERTLPPEEVEAPEEGVEIFEEEPKTSSLVLLGTVLDSDAMYLTLGIVDEEGNGHPKISLKHADVKIIEVYEEDNDLLEEASQIPDGMIN